MFDDAPRTCTGAGDANDDATVVAPAKTATTPTTRAVRATRARISVPPEVVVVGGVVALRRRVSRARRAVVHELVVVGVVRTAGVAVVQPQRVAELVSEHGSPLRRRVVVEVVAVRIDV